MTGILVAEPLIYLMLVGHQVGIQIHMALDNRRYAVVTVVIDGLSTDYTGSLDHHKNRLLGGSLASLVGNSLFLAGLAAEVLFVDLDYAANGRERLVAHVHHLADGMTKLPGSLLRDTDQSGQYYR